MTVEAGRFFRAALLGMALGRTAVAAPPFEPQPSEPVLGPYRRPPPTAPAAELPVGGDVRDAGRWQHDGFYLRLGGGLGYGFDALQSNALELFLSEADGARGHVTGMAAASEVMLGTSVWRALVLGLACDTVLLPGPTAAGAPGIDDYEFQATQLAIFAPFADFYPWERAGLHFQASGGLAVIVLGAGISASVREPAQAHTAVGPGFVLGAGHEWWVADQWSVGVLGRFMYGWAQGQDPLGASWSHEMGSMSMLVTATYQ